MLVPRAWGSLESHLTKIVECEGMQKFNEVSCIIQIVPAAKIASCATSKGGYSARISSFQQRYYALGST